MTARSRRHTTSAWVLVACGLVAFLSFEPISVSADCEWKWSTWTVITDPTITSPTAENNVVCINDEVGFTCSECTDTDAKRQLDPDWQPYADSVTYTWSAGGGTFPYGNTGRTVTWKAPATCGKYTVTVTVDDVDDQAVPGCGSDDDASKQAHRDMIVVEVDLDISGVADADEVTVGGFVCLNDDDDDDDVVDKDDASVPGEDDLLAITLDMCSGAKAELPGTDTVTLTWTTTPLIFRH